MNQLFRKKYPHLIDGIDANIERKETLKRGLLHFLKTHFPRTFPPPRKQEDKL